MCEPGERLVRPTCGGEKGAEVQVRLISVAGRDQPDDSANSDSHAANAGLAAHYFGATGNSREIAHLLLVCRVTGPLKNSFLAKPQSSQRNPSRALRLCEKDAGVFETDLRLRTLALSTHSMPKDQGSRILAR